MIIHETEINWHTSTVDSVASDVMAGNVEIKTNEGSIICVADALDEAMSSHTYHELALKRLNSQIDINIALHQERELVRSVIEKQVRPLELRNGKFNWRG